MVILCIWLRIMGVICFWSESGRGFWPAPFSCKVTGFIIEIHVAKIWREFDWGAGLKTEISTDELDFLGKA